MARFIINEKIYDTEKMTLIGHVKKWYETRPPLFLQRLYECQKVGRTIECELYRSNKGNYLLVHEGDYSNFYGEAIVESEAKNLLMHHDYDNYTKLFGDLEEA